MTSLYAEKLDPRNVLVCAFLLSVTLACLSSLRAAAIGLGASALLAAFSGVSFRWFYRRLLTVNIFVAFIWLVTPWSTPGEILWQWKFFSVSREGVELSLLAAIKCNAIVCVFLALVAPMRQSVLGNALYRLKMPEKLVWIFLLMDRNIHVLGEVWQKLRVAAKLRAFSATTSIHAYKTIASMLAVLLLKSFDRAETLREAMLLRAFSGRLPCMEQFHFGILDFGFDALVLALTAFLWLLESGVALG